MPGESSSISSGTTNGPYPIRETYIMKTNDTSVNHWCAPDSTKLKNWYQSAWDISTTDMIRVYAVMQKWTDQGISADLFVKIIGDDKVAASSMINDYLDMVKFGMKTRYYIVSLTSNGVNLDTTDSAFAPEEPTTLDENCESCTL
jgi:ribonucleoside-diphosphate reductase alpha chain